MTVLTASLNAQTRAYYVDFEYDSDGNRTSRVISVGPDRNELTPTDTIGGNGINIYHDTATNSVFVNITDLRHQDTITVTLLSPSGNSLETKEMGADPVEFDLSGRPAGTYTIELRSGAETKTRKIIIR